MRKPLRFKRKKKRVSFLRQRFFWYGTGLLLLFTFFFWIVVFSPWLTIQEIRVEGAREIPEERILFTVEDSFWQNFLFMPQNSVLLFNTKVMEEKLLYAFPLIFKISLQRSLPKTIIVKIKEREQVGTWCPPAQAGKDTSCLALDAGGIPYKEVEDTNEYVVFYFEGNASLGQELLAPSLLSTLLDFKERFQKAGESVRFLTIAFTIGQRGEVRGVTKEGWTILLNLTENMEWQQTKLQLVLEQKIPLEKRGELQYIDLRFGDQAYIKYQD